MKGFLSAYRTAASFVSIAALGTAASGTYGGRVPLYLPLAAVVFAFLPWLPFFRRGGPCLPLAFWISSIALFAEFVSTQGEGSKGEGAPGAMIFGMAFFALIFFLPWLVTTLRGWQAGSYRW